MRFILGLYLQDVNISLLLLREPIDTFRVEHAKCSKDCKGLRRVSDITAT